MNGDHVVHEREGTRVLKRMSLGPQHLSQSRTRHYLPSDNANPYPNFVSLEIAQYEGDTAFYLFHVTDSGEVADTWHSSVQDAMEQAEFEFGVTTDEWQDVIPPPG